MELVYWSVRSSNRRGGDVVKRVDDDNRFFEPATSFALLENMKIWCYIQVIIYPLHKLKICVNFSFDFFSKYLDLIPFISQK